jgi:hypothetical protein
MTMQRTVAVLTVGLLSFGVSQSAKAGLVTEWNFTAAANPVGNYAPSSNPGNLASPYLSVSGGSVIPTVTGGALNYNWTGTGTKLTGCSFLLTLPASGYDYSGLSVSLLDTVTGPVTLTGQWSYKLDNGTYQNTGNPVDLLTASGSNPGPSTDLTGVNFSSSHTLYLLFTMSGSGGSGGTVTFDNLDFNATGITPVPEPVHYALAIFGIVFVGTGVSRWYHVRLKRS